MRRIQVENDGVLAERELPQYTDEYIAMRDMQTDTETLFSKPYDSFWCRSNKAGTNLNRCI